MGDKKDFYTKILVLVILGLCIVRYVEICVDFITSGYYSESFFLLIPLIIIPVIILLNFYQFSFIFYLIELAEKIIIEKDNQLEKEDYYSIGKKESPKASKLLGKIRKFNIFYYFEEIISGALLYSLIAVSRYIDGFAFIGFIIFLLKTLLFLILILVFPRVGIFKYRYRFQMIIMQYVMLFTMFIFAFVLDKFSAFSRSTLMIALSYVIFIGLMQLRFFIRIKKD